MADPAPSHSVYTPVLFAGLLSLLLGMVLAAVSLIGEPVRELTVPLREEQVEAGKVYFLKGRDVARAQSWAPQLVAIQAGEAGAVSLDESELNLWSRTRLAPPVGMRQSDEEEASPPRFFLRTVDPVRPPNFRIEEGGVQIAVILPSPFSLGGASAVYQVHGSFTRDEGEGETPRFTLTRSNWGQMPVGFLSGSVEERLFQGIFRLYADSEEFRALAALWPRVEAAELTEGRLNLRFRAEDPGP